MNHRLENAATQVRHVWCTTANTRLLVTAAWAGVQGIALAQATGEAKAVPAAE